MDTNNYYPFGLNHISGSFSTSGFGSFYSYKYNGKELQENGMYDYGARMYMSDLGRWGTTDPLAEGFRRFSPYHYGADNPVMFVDPDGMRSVPYDGGIISNVPEGSFWFAGMNGSFISTPEFKQGSRTGGGNNKGTVQGPKPGFWGRVSNWWDRLFGRNKGADILTLTRGAEVSRAVEVGEPIRIAEFFSAIEVTSVAVGAATLGAVLTPVMMKDPEYNWARDLPFNVPATTTTDDSEPGEMITLYRGVSSKAKGSMYFEASQGIAIPNGYRQVAATWGPHSDMEAHAGGDNLSIWTSWSTSKESARDFATGVAMYENGIPGIIISKKFKVGTVLPNPYNPQEAEWLVPGVVYGAKVEYVLPR
ncbi:RHS repeat-associated core domain-containing protein [Chryseobacterium sp. NRRL B-14798]|uniref:RHS repeat-associated core domain-containing protein n=1 Tax=Chryseobacterium sp. NRRL B-14798 TaxID=3162880 RepID=UPI003D1C710D